MSLETGPVRVIVAGLGNMGRGHALAYHNNPDFQIVGLVNRSAVDLPDELSDYPRLASFEDALSTLDPDLASICTYSDSHADYAIKAMRHGADVFLEKPMATTVADAERVAEVARVEGRKLVVGYILRHHPSWIRLIGEARALGGPYVFRLNLKPAVLRRQMGHAQAADADHVAHRRLRCPTIST